MERPSVSREVVGPLRSSGVWSGGGRALGKTMARGTDERLQCHCARLQPSAPHMPSLPLELAPLRVSCVRSARIERRNSLSSKRTSLAGLASWAAHPPQTPAEAGPQLQDLWVDRFSHRCNLPISVAVVTVDSASLSVSLEARQSPMGLARAFW